LFAPRRLHERKLLRLQQEEEAELVAQRERELELQVDHFFQPGGLFNRECADGSLPTFSSNDLVLLIIA
jgi:hypothetical protein